MRRLILRSFQSPGDIVMLTAAVRDLHRAHPGKFQTDVRTSADALWENNPHITKLKEKQVEVETLDMHYPLIHQSNQRPYHFIHGYPQYLEQQLNLPIPISAFYGDIHLSQEERSRPPSVCDFDVDESYWLIVAGGKYDFTAKWWNPESFQAVVDQFRGKIRFVQCGEAGHWHPRLRGVVDLVGKTGLRAFVRLVYHADGVLCPVTLAMHLAAAVESKRGPPGSRPCVVVAGGREPPHWEAYPRHRFLSTSGALSCCLDGGCWKSRCQLVGDGDRKERYDLCEQPVQISDDLQIPKCMTLIEPQDVIRAIETYYNGGILNYHAKDGVTPMTNELNASQNGRLHESATLAKTGVSQNVLIRFGHGLGDAAQFTIVARHIEKYRPEWNVEVVSLRGKHSAFDGLVSRSWYDAPGDRGDVDFDRVFNVGWHETARSYGDAPSTKVTRCLLEEFEIEPDPSLYRYKIEPSSSASQRAAAYLDSVCGDLPRVNGRYPVLLLHYQGNTSQRQKDLTHEQAKGICEAARAAGLVPVVLDWDNRSPLIDQETVFCPTPGDGDIWGEFGSGDAGALAALIELSTIMVGIDSGPLHVAGATNTDTLAVWTEHFPGQYFDLCDNVTHLIPKDWQSIGLARQSASRRYFEDHYRFSVYTDFVGLVTDEVFKRVGAAEKDGLVFRSGFWVRKDNIEQDLVIVRDIYEQDAYRTCLLADKSGPEVVLDIGSHIGCFAKLWHQKNPQARIICVEACPENLAALRRNVGEFAEVVHAACTYESEPVALLNAVRADCESTGGSVVVPKSQLNDSELRQEGYQYWHDLRELSTITLEELLEREGASQIDVIKLDCEGSEYSILSKTPSLDKIRFILGEYHGRTRWDRFRGEHMADWDYGHMYDGGENGGLFHYANPTAAPDATDASITNLKSQRPTLYDSATARIAVPAGIGDSLWALTKLPDLLKFYGIEQADIALCGGPPHRAKEFVERFEFVRSAIYSNWECVESDRYTKEGVYNWAPSGVEWHDEYDFMLQANRHLETGQRLETWLPEFETDWLIADRFYFKGAELRNARELADRIGPYCVFYLGPEAGNTTSGHNRGSLWTPNDWCQIAEQCRGLGLGIVVAGADYDRSYFDKYLATGFGACENAIGHWQIGETFAVIQRAQFVVAYQSGIGAFSTYMGVPTAMFWRPQGNSIDPCGYVSFDEGMASAWVPQRSLAEGRYLPLIYTKCSPASIVEHVVNHDWVSLGSAKGRN